MKEPGLAAQPFISGLTSKDFHLRVASYTTSSAWRYSASTTATLCPIYHRNFLDAAHIVSHSTSIMAELARSAYPFLRFTATLY
jgi:hypothetical protein